MRRYLPSLAFYLGPFRLFKADARREFFRRIAHIARHGCTEPIEILMGCSLIITGGALFGTGSDFLHPLWAWAAAYIFFGLLMIGAMLTRDTAARMWSGFFCFQLRIWVASQAFLANPPDLQWAGAFIGSMVGLWLFLRYFCVILHTAPKPFPGAEKRHTRRRMQDFTIDFVGDLCVPKR